MIREYKTVEEISGPLMMVRMVENVTYDELVEIELHDGSLRRGKVLEVNGDAAVVQLFESAAGINLADAKVRFLGHPLQLGVSGDMLGRVFNGMGQPIDGGPDILPEEYRDINGLPMNPAARDYPNEFIQTGVSTIDGLNTLVRGQKLPIFSVSGEPYNQLLARIAMQAEVDVIVLGGMGLKYDDYLFFRDTLEKSGAMGRTVMFVHTASDPTVECTLVPDLSLAVAEQFALAGKRVLIRSDLNAPRDEAGNITDETRLIASVPAIRLALDAGAAVMVMSHLGRPTEGECRPEDSLAGITVRMSELVGVPITLSRRYLEEGVQIKPGQVVMLENCRCNKGEKKNNEELAKAYAALCDVYVNDAFGTAHRAQASTEGVARFASVACAGPLMASEIEALTKAVAQAEHPLVAIVGGSKVSTKLTILNNLAQKVDQLIVGGGIANTFLLAAGYKVGKSLAEPELVDECKKVLETLKAKGATLPLPVDVVAAKNFSPEGPYRTCAVEDVADDEMILDVGPKTAQILADYVSKAKTIVWNGPVGVFEMAPYAQGTAELAKAIAQATSDGAFSIAGGGDTVSAVSVFGVADKVSYISTGGGAFLEFLEGKSLPAIAVLQQRAAK